MCNVMQMDLLDHSLHACIFAPFIYMSLTLLVQKTCKIFLMGHCNTNDLVLRQMLTRKGKKVEMLQLHPSSQPASQQVDSLLQG